MSLFVWCLYISQCQKKPGDAKGGPYIGVHLRRKDYVRAHAKQVPSLKYAAEQIEKILQTYKLKKVFIATDAPTDGKYLLNLINK